MKNILVITALLSFVAIQNACNKPDAGVMMEGSYNFAVNTRFEKDSFKYAPLTGALEIGTKVYTLEVGTDPATKEPMVTKMIYAPTFDYRYFMNETPKVIITRKSSTTALFQQFAPEDNFEALVTFKLDHGGTYFESEIENGVYVSGASIGYKMQYNIIDTTNKLVVRVSGVPVK